MTPLLVNAGIIIHKNKILIAERFIDALNASKWEFPGGKLEDNENLKECLIREIKEELDLEISVGDIFEVVYHRNKDRYMILFAYLCYAKTLIAIDLECISHQWIDINELHNYDFMDADKAIVEKILSIGEKLFDL